VTKGSIYKKILLFSLPVFLGQLLQQLYSVADSAVVGNFVGKEALAAVSSSGSFIFLIVGFINGLFMGAGIIIGNRYGAGEEDALHTAVHTGIGFSLISGVFLTIFGYLITPTILRLMNTPSNVMPNSVLYLRIFFLGGLANVLYNACCGIFQAMGDSKHPLYYLIVSSLLNIFLDILFVVVFGLGIAGAAIATVTSQYISAGLSFYKLTRVTGPHRLIIKDIKIDFDTLKKELSLGFPTGIQNSVIAIANVVVQSNINAFGDLAMAGCGSYFKLEGFAFLPITSFCTALTTFTSQNLGAGLFDRAKKGARFGIISGVALAETTGIILYFIAPIALRLFSNDPDVIAFGELQIKTEALFYCMLAFAHCMAAVLRGAGKTTVPMFVMLGCWCLFRITYITIAVKLRPVISTVFMAYPITWTLSVIIFLIYYHKVNIYKDNIYKTAS
jgi:putative MATE family efflux protein